MTNSTHSIPPVDLVIVIDETLSYEDLEKWKSDHGQVVASIRLKS